MREFDYVIGPETLKSVVFAAIEIRAALRAMFSISRASKRMDIVGYRRIRRRSWTAKHIRALKTLAKEEAGC